ncbi:MAG: 23S rRNA (guanosine(2251)-2'-O)-methyltransferase RlmB [Fibrobacteria bacterium]|nr:23S rRNA (guanosine(2251)-2'-O)-methyltransferase RlmB [Fibrobacteria bacterium]
MATEETSIIAGINPVESLLKNSPDKINHLVFQKDSGNKKLFALQKIADQLKIRVHQLPMSKLDNWYRNRHQGILAFCNSRSLDDWQEIRQSLIQQIKSGETPFIVFAAAIEDPRNLGACIRSASGLGAQAVMFPNKGTCGLTATAAKAAAGAAEIISICRVNNPEEELNQLKDEGFKIIGLEENSPVTIHETSYNFPTILVIGGEDKGIPPHIKRTCDIMVKIPISSKTHSYNTSVALSIMLYELNRQNNFSLL